MCDLTACVTCMRLSQIISKYVLSINVKTFEIKHWFSIYITIKLLKSDCSGGLTFERGFDSQCCQAWWKSCSVLKCNLLLIDVNGWILCYTKLNAVSLYNLVFMTNVLQFRHPPKWHWHDYPNCFVLVEFKAWSPHFLDNRVYGYSRILVASSCA